MLGVGHVVTLKTDGGEDVPQILDRLAGHPLVRKVDRETRRAPPKLGSDLLPAQAGNPHQQHLTFHGAEHVASRWLIVTGYLGSAPEGAQTG